MSQVIFMKITNYTEMNRGSFLATFDLELPSGMTIVGMRHMDGKNGKWVAFPERPYQKDGETKYAKIITISDRSKSDKFNELVLAAIEASHD
jgi:DNA-binding cell septation regulator SpoVG